MGSGGSDSGDLHMHFNFAMRTFSLANKAGNVTGRKKLPCVDALFAARSLIEVTKVASNVDKAGRDVLLSGQEGICVQWR
jgi:hypothetical protein